MLDKRPFIRLARVAVDDAIAIPEDAEEELRYNLHGSVLRRLLTAITDAAVDCAAKHHVAEDEFEYVLLPKAVDIIRNIQNAFVSDPYRADPKNWNFWEHQRFVIERIKKKDVPRFARSELHDYPPGRSRCRVRNVRFACLHHRAWQTAEQATQPPEKWSPVRGAVYAAH